MEPIVGQGLESSLFGYGEISKVDSIWVTIMWKPINRKPYRLRYLRQTEWPEMVKRELTFVGVQ